MAVPEAILFTGGIGDVLAVESYFSDGIRQVTKTIYYATRAAKVLTELFALKLPCFPRLADQVTLWKDFSDFFAFGNKQHCSDYFRVHNRFVPVCWPEVVDYSISVVFPDVHAGRLKFSGSSFIKHKLVDVSRFKLPESYVVVHPYSVNDRRMPNRDFDSEDWNCVIKRLDKADAVGVVLNVGPDAIPVHRRLINLANKTSIAESIEIVKNGKGYFGVDSCLSVIAAQCFDRGLLLVKSRNPHLMLHRNVYYAPHRSFDFIVPSMDFNAIPTVQSIKPLPEAKPIVDSGYTTLLVELEKMSRKAPELGVSRLSHFYALGRYYQPLRIIAFCGGNGEPAIAALNGILDAGIPPTQLTVVGPASICNASGPVRKLASRSSRPVALKLIEGSVIDENMVQTILGSWYDMVLIDGAVSPPPFDKTLITGWSVLANGGCLAVFGIDDQTRVEKCESFCRKVNAKSYVDAFGTYRLIRKC